MTTMKKNEDILHIGMKEKSYMTKIQTGWFWAEEVHTHPAQS